MKSVNYRISSGNEILACTADFAEGDIPPSVICLHGGGPSSRESTRYLSEVIQKHGRSVIRFDETKSILKHFKLSEKITVIGTSMGGHVAGSLLKEFDIENLILFCPAAYDEKAWNIEFGSGFTEIIRTEDSFLNSEIFLYLKEFKGNALFVIGENDVIIPEEVISLYKEALSNSNKFESFTIQDCPHPIHRWSIKYPDIRKEIILKVLNTIGYKNEIIH